MDLLKKFQISTWTHRKNLEKKGNLEKKRETQKKKGKPRKQGKNLETPRETDDHELHADPPPQRLPSGPVHSQRARPSSDYPIRPRLGQKLHDYGRNFAEMRRVYPTFCCYLLRRYHWSARFYENVRVVQGGFDRMWNLWDQKDPALKLINFWSKRQFGSITCENRSFWSFFGLFWPFLAFFGLFCYFWSSFVTFLQNHFSWPLHADVFLQKQAYHDRFGYW